MYIYNGLTFQLHFLLAQFRIRWNRLIKESFIQPKVNIHKFQSEKDLCTTVSKLF